MLRKIRSYQKLLNENLHGDQKLFIPILVLLLGMNITSGIFNLNTFALVTALYWHLLVQVRMVKASRKPLLKSLPVSTNFVVANILFYYPAILIIIVLVFYFFFILISFIFTNTALGMTLGDMLMEMITTSGRLLYSALVICSLLNLYSFAAFIKKEYRLFLQLAILIASFAVMIMLANYTRSTLNIDSFASVGLTDMARAIGGVPFLIGNLLLLIISGTAAYFGCCRLYENSSNEDYVEIETVSQEGSSAMVLIVGVLIIITMALIGFILFYSFEMH